MTLRSYECTRCGTRFEPDAVRWRCDCGGWFVLADDGGESPAPVSLRSGRTPEVEIELTGKALRAKLEHLTATGSFKDRGAEVLIGLAVAVGATKLVADSSGNAGAALAAHAAEAGLAIEVFARADKAERIRSYGAEVVTVEGSREDIAAAAIARVESTRAFYASHVYNPWFWAGVQTLFQELDPEPDTLLLPVGNGTLVLGAAASTSCRVIGVQAEACAPIAAAFAAGQEEIEPVVARPTVAEGVAIAAPARGNEVLESIRRSGGRVVTVTDHEILAAQRRLAKVGHDVEPTAAVAAAAADRLTDDDGDVVVVIT